MKNWWLVAVTLLLACPAFAQGTAEGSHAVVSEARRTPFAQSLLEVEQAFLAALDRGDAAYVKNAVADDFVGVGSNGDSSGKKDMLEDLHARKPGGDQERPILYFFEVVPLNEGAAVVTYDAVRPGERPRYVHVSNTWVKQGGQWKLMFEQETPNLWSALDTD
jgi:hypothetical protein